MFTTPFIIMLANHVSEKTNPDKFASPHIRRLVRSIQDPDEAKISEAREAWRNSKVCFWNLISYEEYVDIREVVSVDRNAAKKKQNVFTVLPPSL